MTRNILVCYKDMNSTCAAAVLEAGSSESVEYIYIPSRELYYTNVKDVLAELGPEDSFTVVGLGMNDPLLISELNREDRVNYLVLVFEHRKHQLSQVRDNYPESENVCYHTPATLDDFDQASDVSILVIHDISSSLPIICLSFIKWLSGNPDFQTFDEVYPADAAFRPEEEDFASHLSLVALTCMYLDDRNTWKFKYKYTNQFIAGVSYLIRETRFVGKEYAQFWTELFSCSVAGFQKVIEDGTRLFNDRMNRATATVYRYNNVSVFEMPMTSKKTFTVACVNDPDTPSDTGKLIFDNFPGIDIVLAYAHRHQEISVEVRSTEASKVNALAFIDLAMYRGGGHNHASGFRLFHPNNVSDQKTLIGYLTSSFNRFAYVGENRIFELTSLEKWASARNIPMIKLK